MLLSKLLIDLSIKKQKANLIYTNSNISEITEIEENFSFVRLINLKRGNHDVVDDVTQKMTHKNTTSK